MAAAAVVMARAPRAGHCNHRLEPMLGAERCATLQAVLLRRVLDWAGEVAPGRVAVAFEPVEAADDVRAVAGAGVEVWPEASAERAAQRAFERFGGPVLVAGTDMPRLRAAHAAVALLDLSEGADAAFGPAHDGGWYLVALREPHPGLLAADGLAECLKIAAQRELEIGLLRMERDLATPEDAAALLADPLTPADVRAALRG